MELGQPPESNSGKKKKERRHFRFAMHGGYIGGNAERKNALMEVARTRHRKTNKNGIECRVNNIHH